VAQVLTRRQARPARQGQHPRHLRPIGRPGHRSARPFRRM